MALKIKLVKKASEEVMKQISDKNIIETNNLVSNIKKNIKKKQKYNELENLHIEFPAMSFWIKKSKEWNKVLFFKYWENEYFWLIAFHKMIKKATVLNITANRLKTYTDNLFVNKN